MFAVLTVAFAVGVLEPVREQINSTTIALALLLAVVTVAILWGSGPALLASVIGMVSFNFFFLEPVRTFVIADANNWIALAAFLFTAVTVGQLSARAKQRALEAEVGRQEIERLYRELRDAFELASRAEALRQSELLKSALLDAVTHDLRTPLTSIKAAVTTLLETRDHSDDTLPLDDEGRQEFLEVINEETDRLNNFIEGLVDLARIEAGELILRRGWANVDEFISAALKRAESLTASHVIEVESEKDLPVVRVDARALSEVMYTLVDNAAKYSPAGTRIRIEARRAPDDFIEVSVEDEGSGIVPELRDRIFEKFFRATDETRETTERLSGLGMGLAIAYGIVSAHGGRIWVENRANGKGSRFSFVVPIGDDEELVNSEL